MKGFVLVDIKKDLVDDYKATTESGKEIYIKKSDLICFEPQETDAEDFGMVKVNGIGLSHKTVKLFLQIYEALLRKYEDLKEAYRKAVE